MQHQSVGRGFDLSGSEHSNSSSPNSNSPKSIANQNGFFANKYQRHRSEKLKKDALGEEMKDFVVASQPLADIRLQPVIEEEEKKEEPIVQPLIQKRFRLFEPENEPMAP